MKKACLRNITLHVSTRCFDLNLPEKIISDARICESGSQKMMHNGGNDAKLKTRLSKSSPIEVKMLVEFIRGGISGVNNILRLAISQPIEKRKK
jgi:hypothetical protein